MFLSAATSHLRSDADIETEAMRAVDPAAARVWPPLKEIQPLRQELAKLLHQIEVSMGQRAEHIGQVAGPGAWTSTRLAVMGLGKDKTVPTPVQPQRKPEGVSEPDLEDVFAKRRARDAALRNGELPVSEPLPMFGWVQDHPDDGSWRERLRAERQRRAEEYPEIQAANRAYTESLTGAEYEKAVEGESKGYRDRLALDDGFRWEAAGVLAPADAGHGVVKGLRDRLATDDRFRWQVAEAMTLIDWEKLPSYGGDADEPAPVAVSEPVPVAEPEIDSKEAGMELYRVRYPESAPVVEQ